MKLSKTMTNRLVEELKYAAGQMQKTEIIEEKLYYFSAVYGMAQRVLNFEYSSELVCIYQVTQLAYTQIQARIGLAKSGKDSAIGIPSQLFNILTDLVKELASSIEKEEPFYPVLEKMMVLSYTTNGNGYYLLQKGLLKL
jgi:hypothetical protein